MNGIELSERYFFEAALPLLKEKYPHLLNRVAAGLVAGGFDSGCGSEIGGFDDELSRDHNWGPRFFLFMHPEDKREIGKEVQDFLDSSLPAEFSGFKSTATTLPKNRAYVVTPDENLMSCLGMQHAPDTDESWIMIPEVQLFEYTAGHIFYEPTPLVSPLRSQFKYYPDNVWFKRLSYAFFMIHLVGNVRRSARRQDVMATQTYTNWFLQIAMRTCFLLRRRYAPYCKWLFKAFRQLPDLPEGLPEQIEKAATHIGMEIITEQLYAIADHVGSMANATGLIGELHLRKQHPMVWTDFNCYAFAEAFQKKVSGAIAEKPWHEGPYDLLSANGNINQEVMKAAWTTMKG